MYVKGLCSMVTNIMTNVIKAAPTSLLKNPPYLSEYRFQVGFKKDEVLTDLLLRMPGEVYSVMCFIIVFYNIFTNFSQFLSNMQTNSTLFVSKHECNPTQKWSHWIDLFIVLLGWLNTGWGVYDDKVMFFFKTCR